MAVNLGDINFGLGADFSRLEQAIRVVNTFGQTVDRVAGSQAQGARSVEAALRRQETAITSSIIKTQNLNDSIRRVAGSSPLLDQTTAAFNKLTNELGRGRVSTLQLQRSMEDFRQTINNISRDLKTLQDAEQAEVQMGRVMAAVKKEMVAAERDWQASISQSEGLLRRQENALTSAGIKVQNLTNSMRGLGGSAPLITQANEALVRLSTGLTAAGNNSLQASRALNEFRLTINGVTQSLRVLESEQVKSTISGSAFGSGLSKLSAVSILVAGPMSGIATRLALISSLFNEAGSATVAFAVGAAGAAAAFSIIGYNAVNAAKQLQQLQLSFTAVSGSSAIAASETEYILDVSKRTGVAFEKLAQEYAILSAASKGTALEGQKTRDVFEGIVFTSAKLGLSSDRVQLSLLAVRQMMEKGRVMSEELRKQLGQSLPGAMAAMAAATGHTTAELDQLMRKGQISSAVLGDFVKQLEIMFNVDVSKNIDTITAAEGRLSTAVFQFGTAVDKTLGVSQAYTATLNGMAASLEFLGNNFKTILEVIGAAAGALAGFYSGAVISGILSLAAAIRTTALAMWGLNAAMLANPIGEIAAVIGKLILTLGGAAAAFLAFSHMLGSSSGDLGEAEGAIDKYIEAQKNLKSSIIDSTNAAILQLRAIMALKEAALDAAQVKLTEAKSNTRITLPGTPDNYVALQQQGEAQQAVDDAMAQVNSYRDKFKALDIIMKAQIEKAKEISQRSGVAAVTPQQLQAMDDLLQKIDDARGKLEALGEASGLRKWALALAEVDKKTEEEYTKLNLLNFSQADLTKLTYDYKIALMNLARAEFSTPIMEQLSKIETRIREAYNQTQQLRPGQPEYQVTKAQSSANIAKEIDTERQALVKLGTDSLVVMERLVRLQTALEKLDAAKAAQKVQLAFQSVAVTLQETREKIDALSEDSGLRKWAVALANVDKQINAVTKTLTDTGPITLADKLLIDQLRVALTQLARVEFSNAINDQLKSIQEQTKRAADEAAALRAGPRAVGQLEHQNALADIQKRIDEAQRNLSKVGTNPKVLTETINNLKKALEDLQSAKEFEKMKTAINSANESLDEANQKFDALRRPQGRERLFAELDADVAKRINTIRDALKLAQVPIPEITKLVNELTAAFQRLGHEEIGIKIQEQFDKIQQSIEDAQGKIDQIGMAPGQRRMAEALGEINTKVKEAVKNAIDAGASADEAAVAGERWRQVLIKLNQAETQERQRVPIKGAQDTIRELQQQANILRMRPQDRGLATIQAEINKQVEDFRDKLTQAEVPAKVVADLTNQFAENLAKLKGEQYVLQTMPNAFNTIANSISGGLDQGLDGFVKAITEGGDALESLRQTALSVVQDLIKSFLQLALLNPFKNWLFGGNPATGQPFPVLSGIFGGVFGGGQSQPNTGLTAPVATAVAPVAAAAATSAASTTIASMQNLAKVGTGITSSAGMPEMMANFFKTKGMTNPYGLGAIMGFSEKESGLLPGALGLKGDAGLFQWTGGRKSGMEAVAGDAWKTNPRGQMEYAYQEFIGQHGQENAVWDKLMNAKSDREAASIMQGFERPKYYDPNIVGSGLGWQKGLAYTTKWREKFGNGAPQAAAGLQASNDNGILNNLPQALPQQNLAQGPTLSLTNDFAKLSAQVKDTTTVTGNLGSNFTQLSQITNTGADTLTAAVPKLATSTDALSNTTATASQGLGGIFTSLLSGIGGIASTFLGGFASIFKTILGGLGSIGGGGASAGGGAGFAGIFTWIGHLFGLRDGGVVRRAAKGEILNQPTFFNTTVGPVIGGEAGQEAIMPLSRGPDGRLGVSMHHGSNLFSDNNNSRGDHIETHVYFAGPPPSNAKDTAKLSSQLESAVVQAVDKRIMRQQKPGGLLESTRKHGAMVG